MKRTLALLLAVLIVLSMGVLFVSAEDTGAEVFVTIADKDGKLALACEKVQVTDIDADGALTVNDALYAAHEQFYEGGAAAGYETEMTKYGLSLTRLWGTANGYSYGYYVNNVSAWSLTDPVKDDDYVAAYVFTDTEKLADKYTYFENVTQDEETGEISLTLSKADFDEDWNSITVPVAGAVITVDGEASDAVTDEEGKATVTVTVNGKHIVSAIAPEGQVNVPPVYIAEITGGVDPEPVEEPTDEPTEAPQADVTEVATEAATEASTVAPTSAATVPATKDTATKDTATKDSSSSTSPKTGDSTNRNLWIFITVACLIGACVTFVVYKKRYEK